MKFESRNKAAQAIKAHSILVNGKVCDKPSYDVSDTDVVEVAFDALKYVSRGGYKLAGALEKFRIDFSTVLKSFYCAF